MENLKNDATSNMIVRTVKVNRNQSPQEMLDATGRKQYIDQDVLKTAPVKQPGYSLEFFKPGKWLTNKELKEEYKSRGLIPADLETLLEYDIKERSKMDGMKNVATIWDEYCFASFMRCSDGERFVDVNRYAGDWSDNWRFAGLRK